MYNYLISGMCYFSSILLVYLVRECMLLFSQLNVLLFSQLNVLVLFSHWNVLLLFSHWNVCQYSVSEICGIILLLSFSQWRVCTFLSSEMCVTNLTLTGYLVIRMFLLSHQLPFSSPSFCRHFWNCLDVQFVRDSPPQSCTGQNKESDHFWTINVVNEDTNHSSTSQQARVH